MFSLRAKDNENPDQPIKTVNPDEVNPIPSDLPKGPSRTSWWRLKSRARTIAQIVTLFTFLVTAGAVAGFFYANSRHPSSTTTTKAPTITSLSADDLNKLSQISGSLGTNGQVLNIGADALFRGKADISGDLSIGGRLNANGPVTLSALNIAGASGSTGLNVGTNLVVGGTATFQNTLSVAGLASATNLSVTGNASINALNATTIAVRTISISGPLTIGHLVTQGPTPSINAVNAGTGGTVSISGNDTAGTINLNTGTGPGNVLATVTFRAPYGTNVHVMLTPLTAAAATSGYYVTRTSGGFQIHANTAASGQTLSFDYVVVQ